MRYRRAGIWVLGYRRLRCSIGMAWTGWGSRKLDAVVTLMAMIIWELRRCEIGWT